MNILFVIARVLIIVGGLNWGLVGAFDFNLVDTIFGAGSAASRVVYVLVGIAAIIALIELFVPRRAVNSDRV
ncbi:DUF378 domain-containing protein [Microbacterium sp. A82]|uniref:DUF378 domain-containing protein n=1 Tax=Microbacterium sp. A82 TaxID=3450452 RepID=UPI003F3648BA